jgi:hypothetical protein
MNVSPPPSGLKNPGTRVSKWLQTEPPVENTQLYKNRGRERERTTLEVSREERGRGSGRKATVKPQILHGVPLWGGCSSTYSAPPKRRFTQDVHGATSQKTALFVITAVKT